MVRPVPIPNTAVKRSLADGSGFIDSARVGCRHSFIKSPRLLSGFFCCHVEIFTRCQKEKGKVDLVSLIVFIIALIALTFDQPEALGEVWIDSVSGPAPLRLVPDWFAPAKIHSRSMRPQSSGRPCTPERGAQARRDLLMFSASAASRLSPS